MSWGCTYETEKRLSTYTPLIVVGAQVKHVLQLADDLVAVLARARAVVLVRHGGPMSEPVSSVACMKGEVFAPDIARLPVADAIELADVSLQLGQDGVDGSLRDGDDLGVGAVVGEFLRVGAYASVSRLL